MEARGEVTTGQDRTETRRLPHLCVVGVPSVLRHGQLPRLFNRHEPLQVLPGDLHGAAPTQKMKDPGVGNSTILPFPLTTSSFGVWSSRPRSLLFWCLSASCPALARTGLAGLCQVPCCSGSSQSRTLEEPPWKPLAYLHYNTRKVDGEKNINCFRLPVSDYQ